MSARRCNWLVTVLALAAGGCGDDDGGTALQAPEYLAPGLARDTQLVLVDAAGETARWLSVDVDEAGAVSDDLVEVPANPRALFAREGHDDQALLLAEGLQGVAMGATLSVLGSDGEVTPFALGEAFDSIAQDPDGRFAVAFHRQGSAELVFGAQQVGIVDVDEDEARARVLSTPAGLPGLLSVSPELDLGGDPTHLLAVGSPAHVTLLALDTTDATEVVVQLTGFDGATVAEPTQLLFDADATRLFVRMRDADDVYVLSFDAPGEESGTLAPRVGALPAGAAPSDMGSCGGADARRLAVLTSDGRELWTFSGDDAIAQRAQLAQRVDRMLPFEAQSDAEANADTETQLLLYRVGSPWVGIASCPGAEDALPALGFLRLDANVQQVVELEGQPRALLVHDDTLVSVVDLQRRTRMLVNLTTGVQTAVQAAGVPVLWLGAPGQYLAAALDLEDGSSHEVLLEAPIAQIVLVPEAERAAVVHPDGSLTLLDLFEPSVEAALRVPAPQ